MLVEITARFDEAPNIAWGDLLEREGVHVAYGVERLKTHVKLALVVREEEDGIHRYVHVGTGNYHTGTARIYEDMGLLSCDPKLGANVAALFNELTSANPYLHYDKLLVAPHNLRERITELIRREAEHKRKGKPCGINVKMNQLQDTRIIQELYRAGQAGVPITLNIRGLCCLRAGVPGLSENIRVFCTLGRFFFFGGDQHHSGVIGCGLGLAIVKHIVDLYGASIDLQKSSFESGLAVSVLFPQGPRFGSAVNNIKGR